MGRQLALVPTASEETVAGHDHAQADSVFPDDLGTILGAVRIHGATVSVDARYVRLIKFNYGIGCCVVVFGWVLGPKHLR